MSWNPHMESHYVNNSYPYNSAGSFIEYFEGLTYEHVNFIFNGSSYGQDSVYPSMNSNPYKFDISQLGTAYYNSSRAYEIHDQEHRIDEYRRPFENSSTMFNGQTAAVVGTEWEVSESMTTHDDPVECLRRHHSAHDNQVTWQDNIDPDNMTYEELLELGEAVGTQNRGLSKELISLLPISKYKPGFFFFRRKSRSERCVICQMEYKRGDRQITLPCKHVYHARCGTKWLSINKACPVCYTEVFGDASKIQK